MKRVVVNGTFDIIHPGHIHLLNYARSIGDYVLVAIDTDQRVKELKGLDRPVNNQTERKLLLENLRAVDEVKLFNSDQDLEYILKEYNPDIMVKGSDYRGRPIVGEKYCRSIVFFDRIECYSSTKKIERIKHVN